MNVTLFTTDSEINRINKTLSNPLLMVGTARTDISVETPSIDVRYTSDITAYNYCYIPEFGRYYFIVDKVFINDKLCSLKLKVDVLMSFRSDILSTKMIIERSEVYNKSYIADTSKTAYNFPMVLTKRFSGQFPEPNFFLTTATYSD